MEDYKNKINETDDLDRLNNSFNELNVIKEYLQTNLKHIIIAIDRTEARINELENIEGEGTLY